ncbi:MAG: TIGR00296 family protein, partial [Thermoplasmatales archaeon]|nr:TIGR00296 family protein [Thermoplasmatales archaeon]
LFSKKEGKIAVKIARNVIEKYVRNEKITIKDYPESFKEKSGVFVTINTYPKKELRGCIGYPEPVMRLIDAIIDSAKNACHDPRFPPLEANELNNVVIELSLLTKPELIKISNPKDYPEKIKIGRDGLIAESGFYRGLLLPQVPVEQEWDKETFLSHTCIKAGLMPDAWLSQRTKIYKFQAQVFSETSPNGEIKEREL